MAKDDVAGLVIAHQSYGDSCLRRGGTGLFMMFARKWDRLENQAKKFGWDIFKTYENDQREEGVLDDIRDLRRYLLICEAQLLLKKQIEEYQGKLPLEGEPTSSYVNQG